MKNSNRRVRQHARLVMRWLPAALATMAALLLSACASSSPESQQALYTEPSASASTARMRFVTTERWWSAYVAQNPALRSCYLFNPAEWLTFAPKRPGSEEAQLGMPVVEPSAQRRAAYVLPAGRGITVQVELVRNSASSGGSVTLMHTATCRDNLAFTLEAGKDYEIHANWPGDGRCSVSLHAVERVGGEAGAAQGKLVPAPYASVELPVNAQALDELCTPDGQRKVALARP